MICTHKLCVRLGAICPELFLILVLNLAPQVTDTDAEQGGLYVVKCTVLHLTLQKWNFKGGGRNGTSKFSRWNRGEN